MLFLSDALLCNSQKSHIRSGSLLANRDTKRIFAYLWFQICSLRYPIIPHEVVSIPGGSQRWRDIPVSTLCSSRVLFSGARLTCDQACGCRCIKTQREQVKEERARVHAALLLHSTVGRSGAQWDSGGEQPCKQSERKRPPRISCSIC